MMNNQELAEAFKTSVYNTVHFSAATTKAIGTQNERFLKKPFRFRMKLEKHVIQNSF